MSWQDIITAFCSIFFNLALLPSIKSKSKPALQTSLVSGLLNIVIGVVQITLFLWLSALTTFINAGLWLILAYQKKRTRTRRR